ncbi:PI-PLC X domain-containing protein 3-like [Rhynchophorus ferrugineus]|uniref:PI-PLC X domain-containing protein 3-like n=1 Tax=Rhynchophorus ferrugineus TaxID=354439 RepID=UPI003FCCA805
MSGFLGKIGTLFYIFALIHLINCAPSDQHYGSELQDLADDLENWMEFLPDAIKSVPINYLAIPGTHDSFTSDITKDSEVSPDGEDILKQLEWLSIVKVVMANWSKTQAYDVTAQLQAGIRFFDLRVCNNTADNTLYFCHGLYSTDVQSVLNDMSSYLSEHPNEVVILDCQHFYAFTDDTHATLIGMLKNAFNTTLLPYAGSLSSWSLSSLNDNNYQVILIYRESVQTSETFLWPSSSYPTPWYNTMNSTYLLSSLDTGLSTRSNSNGYISQCVLTPGVNDILTNLLSTLKQKCAVDFESSRTAWILEQEPGANGVNVIIGDFVDLSDDVFSKSIINLNSKLLTTRNIFMRGISRIGQYINDLKRYIFPKLV